MATAQSIALDPGNPMYVPHAPAGTSSGFPRQGAGTITPGGGPGGAPAAVVPVRYAQLTVWDSGSAPVCVGGVQALGPGPAGAGMMLGADMSFAAHELAAGNTFSDAGVTANPISILADHGAGWARLRLWVNPPSGYSDLATDLALAKTIKQAGLELFLDIH